MCLFTNSKGIMIGQPSQEKSGVSKIRGTVNHPVESQLESFTHNSDTAHFVHYLQHLLDVYNTTLVPQASSRASTTSLKLVPPTTLTISPIRQGYPGYTWNEFFSSIFQFTELCCLYTGGEWILWHTLFSSNQ